jgi:hypothetical protein
LVKVIVADELDKEGDPFTTCDISKQGTDELGCPSRGATFTSVAAAGDEFEEFVRVNNDQRCVGRALRYCATGGVMFGLEDSGVVRSNRGDTRPC